MKNIEQFDTSGGANVTVNTSLLNLTNNIALIGLLYPFKFNKNIESNNDTGLKYIHNCMKNILPARECSTE